MSRNVNGASNSAQFRNSRFGFSFSVFSVNFLQSVRRSVLSDCAGESLLFASAVVRVGANLFSLELRIKLDPK